MSPRTLSDPGTRLAIRQESFAEFQGYLAIACTFATDSVLDVVEHPTRWELRERPLEHRFHKDYDAISDPTQWSSRFDATHWGIFGAYLGAMRTGGAVAVFDTPGLDMLEDRDDLAVLWDLRVSPDERRCGIGSALFEAIEQWAVLRNCRELKIETQNNNVAACRFYASHGCTLRQANRGAYRELPLETQLIWRKTLGTGVHA